MFRFIGNHKKQLLLVLIGILVVETVIFCFISDIPFFWDALGTIALAWGLAVFLFFAIRFVAFVRGDDIPSGFQKVSRCIAIVAYSFALIHNMIYFIIEQEAGLFVPIFLFSAFVAAMMKDVPGDTPEE